MLLLLSSQPGRRCLTSTLGRSLSLQPLHTQSVSRPSGYGQIPLSTPEVFCSPAALKWEAGETKVCTLVRIQSPTEAPGPGWGCLAWPQLLSLMGFVLANGSASHTIIPQP